ncbi:type II toxin-antitoxin system HicB family antitoxin [Paraburkholderia sp. RL18-101-BIB-B]|uniref:type II toxin-antitoxin system HicB family antitoxin n=1 Tax=Paraburkholderia sp. RL18-101-BIB-B TaxID=3031634 RepID=UPI0038BDB22B
MTARFPVAIRKNEGAVHGVTIPDFSNCHSWGETIDHAMMNIVQALGLWVETEFGSGAEVQFEPSTIEALRHDLDFANAIWAYVEVDPSKFDAIKYINPNAQTIYETATASHDAKMIDDFPWGEWRSPQ